MKLAGIKNLMQKILLLIKKFKSGDWLVILLFISLIFFITKYYWEFPQGQYLKIEKNNEIIGTYSLNQKNNFIIDSHMGASEIIIDNNRARFSKSPCKKQYCIHQGWIKKINQTIICLPNQISISVIGNKEQFDSINY